MEGVVLPAVNALSTTHTAPQFVVQFITVLWHMVELEAVCETPVR